MGDDTAKRGIGASRREEPVLAPFGLAAEVIRCGARDIPQLAIDAEV
ncbi:hypothetical protein [Thiocapsa marina]|uniref:Uncharacterized protein n=1 Tax=Thiocapsa marina 5811 TaxID=768671 RepID=F9U6Y4_9GAMM|nr:hypothetical protein [Thiocapsa marina]EGV20010.1 hypothetical protein ThimaDRAFT_0686 [Thiocapsa marina 5811]